MGNQLDFTGVQRRCLFTEQILLACTTSGVAELDLITGEGGKEGWWLYDCTTKKYGEDSLNKVGAL